MPSLHAKPFRTNEHITIHLTHTYIHDHHQKLPWLRRRIIRKLGTPIIAMMTRPHDIAHAPPLNATTYIDIRSSNVDISYRHIKHLRKWRYTAAQTKQRRATHFMHPPISSLSVIQCNARRSSACYILLVVASSPQPSHRRTATLVVIVSVSNTARKDLHGYRPPCACIRSCADAVTRSTCVTATS